MPSFSLTASIGRFFLFVFAFCVYMFLLDMITMFAVTYLYGLGFWGTILILLVMSGIVLAAAGMLLGVADWIFRLSPSNRARRLIVPILAIVNLLVMFMALLNMKTQHQYSSFHLALCALMYTGLTYMYIRAAATQIM